MDVRKIIIGSFALLMFGLVYMMFAGGDDSAQKKKSKAEQLTMLLGGGSASSQEYSNKRGHRTHDGKSVFDSEFGTAGVNTNFAEEENSQNSKNANMVTPINPQTGKPYDDETMEQFDKLKLLFPENNLIPKRLTKEEKANKDKEDQDYANASAAVINNNATKDQVQIYFNKQEKTVKDRLEIIEYLIDAQKEDGTLDKDGQFEKILEGAKTQLSQIESQKKEAYQKYGL